MKYLYDREGRKTVEVADYVVIGEDVTFGRNVRICSFSSIGDNSIIGDDVVIESYVQIPAYSKVEKGKIPETKNRKTKKTDYVLERILSG